MLTRRLQNSIWDDFFLFPLTEARTSPRVDARWKEHDDRYDISVAAPGLEKGDFNISIEENVITISYGLEDQKKSFEFVSRFKKSYSLPRDSDLENVSASYKNGVLIVSVPRSEERKGVRTIAVK